ncbi:MAG: hypothetical protein K2M31_04205 [Muribaculaceae bacterium]|nr:hypothetical protein [Muribaculaceae bacterium]
MSNLLCFGVNLLMIWVLNPLRNKTYSFPTFQCSKKMYYGMLGIISVSALVSYPRVFGIYFPINLATIYISTNVIMLMCRRPLRSLPSLLHIGILLLVIAGGDRVDSIASVIMLMIIARDGIRDSGYAGERNLKLRIIIPVLLILFIVGVAAGKYRDGKSIHTILFLRSIYAQQTVCDVVFVYLCSVKEWLEAGFEPKVFLNCIFGLFPGKFYGALSDYNYSVFLNRNVLPNPGGGLYYSEGMLAFGPIGVLAYAFVYGRILYYLFIKSRSSRYAAAVFLTLVIMTFRTQWYGIIFCYKPVIFSLLFCLFTAYWDHLNIFFKNALKGKKKASSIDR